MNILEQIFKIENPKSERPMSNEVFDLLFDWFKAAAIPIADFEKEFFEPCFEALQSDVYLSKDIMANVEGYRRSYYIQIAYFYVIYHYPENAFLNRFFNTNFRNEFSYKDKLEWNNRYNLDSKYPHIFDVINCGVDIAKYYHAIHVNKDINYSNLPYNIESIKFKNNDEYFSKIFNYLIQQHFEAKAYLLFMLYCAFDRKYTYDENGNHTSIKIIETTKYDTQIKEALRESVLECNRLYNLSLDFEAFELLHLFLKFKTQTKEFNNKKAKLDDFKVIQDFFAAVEGKELQILETSVYVMSHEYLSDYDATYKVWTSMIAKITENIAIDADWLERKLNTNYGLKKKNHDFIFYDIYTSLFAQLAPRLAYEDSVVKLFDKKAVAQIAIHHGYNYRNTSAFKQLVTVYNKIENEILKEFHVQKCNISIGATSKYVHNILFTFDTQDKNYATIKGFVENLNVILPTSLTNIDKRMAFYHPENDGDRSFMELNIDGKVYHLGSNTIPVINQMLYEKNTGYQVVPIPKIKIIDEYYPDNFTMIFSLSFLNEDSYKWILLNHISNFEDIRMDIYQNIKYNKQNIPFLQLKAQKQQENATKTISNHFLEDVNWSWFKDRYIDELSSKENWYDIMHVIVQTSSSKKPSKQWLLDCNSAIEKLGAEKYFKELQVLLSNSLKEDFWYFDTYRNALRGLIWSCTYIEPNDYSLSIVKTIIEKAYTKIPGVGAKCTAVGNMGLEALVATGKEEAFGILNIMRNKTKYNKFIVALEKNIDKFKETSTIPEQLLADRAIPRLDFEKGKRLIQVSDYHIILGFEKGKLIKAWQDKNGAKIKTVPKDIDAKLLKQVTEEVKQINSIFTDLKKRIKTYWLYNRTWKGADWQQYILGHDLVYPHIEGLIWTNKTQQKDFILLENQLLHLDYSHHLIAQDDEICLWHPVLNDEINITQWQDYIWSKKIQQPERQAFREHYPFSEKELAMTETPRFAHHFLEVKKLMAITNTVGWTFTYVHEGNNWPRIFLKTANLTAHLLCDYDRYSYAIPTKNLYLTEDNSTNINDYRPKKEYPKIELSKVPIVTLSELCRDIDLFIATTSVAHNPEFSENRQEFDGYRMDYERGLFSDNASAKIRKQIIEKLIPILNINSAGFEGNYLVIKGKSNVYRINLGSGFAQVKDTQKHINLLPNLNEVKNNKKIHLPIEDDDTLYIILAKILYLQNN